MHIRLRSERKGEHVHTTVFVGEDANHLANAGDLVLRVGEWQAFGTALRLGAKQMGDVIVDSPGDENVIK